MNLIGVNGLALTLSTAAPVDVIASYKDSGADQSTGVNTKVTGTDAVFVIPAPGTGRVRRMTDLHVRLQATSTSSTTATLSQSDGTRTWEVMSMQMNPGDALIYEHFTGWRAVVASIFGNGFVAALSQMYPGQLLIPGAIM